MPARARVSSLAFLLTMIAGSASVALAETVPIPQAGGAAQPTVPQPAPAAPAAGASVNAQGHIIAPGAAATEGILPTAATSTACFQLHNGAGVMWNINVTFNPNAYPYTINSGTISGTICSSPWHVTGGTFGPNLQINGIKSPPVSGCATSVGIVGNFGPPGGYNGTYGFFGSTTGFNHHTLFLGFNKATCP